MLQSRNDGDSDWCQQLLVSAAASALPQPGVADGFLNLPWSAPSPLYPRGGFLTASAVRSPG
jgi:hypothetical protein